MLILVMWNFVTTNIIQINIRWEFKLHKLFYILYFCDGKLNENEIRENENMETEMHGIIWGTRKLWKEKRNSLLSHIVFVELTKFTKRI